MAHFEGNCKPSDDKNSLEVETCKQGLSDLLFFLSPRLRHSMMKNQQPHKIAHLHTLGQACAHCGSVTISLFIQALKLDENIVSNKIFVFHQHFNIDVNTAGQILIRQIFCCNTFAATKGDAQLLNDQYFSVMKWITKTPSICFCSGPKFHISNLLLPYSEKVCPPLILKDVLYLFFFFSECFSSMSVIHNVY